MKKQLASLLPLFASAEPTAVLLSAMRPKERPKAKAELVGLVSSRQTPGMQFRSLYPAGSVVGKELALIADQIVTAFGTTPLPQNAWGNFALLLGYYLDEIEGDARAEIEKIRGA